MDIRSKSRIMDIIEQIRIEINDDVGEWQGKDWEYKKGGVKCLREILQKMGTEPEMQRKRRWKG